MTTPSRKFWLGIVLSLAVALALAEALYSYFAEASGVAHTGGALLVIGSSTLVLGAVIAVAFPPELPRGLHWTLEVLIVLGIVGTLLAGWLLMEWWLVSGMILALVVQVLRLAAVRRLRFTEREHKTAGAA